MLQQLLRRLESQATDLDENRAASMPALAAALREVHGPYGFPGSKLGNTSANWAPGSERLRLDAETERPRPDAERCGCWLYTDAIPVPVERPTAQSGRCWSMLASQQSTHKVESAVEELIIRS